MPDITMCKNKTCPLNEKCYRFMAKPDARQSFAVFTQEVDGTCDYFMPLKEKP